MAVKMTRKLSGLLIYSNLKDGSLQQFKGIQVLNKYVKGVRFVSKWGM